MRCTRAQRTHLQRRVDVIAPVDPIVVVEIAVRINPKVQFDMAEAVQARAQARLDLGCAQHRIAAVEVSRAFCVW